METRTGKQLLAAAAAALAEVPDFVWDGETLPVPIEEIADSHFRLRIEDVPDVGRAAGLDSGRRRLSGALVPKRGLILVDATEARDVPRRRRYTIAHEIGHWCLHRELGVTGRCDGEAVQPVESLNGGSGHSLENWRQPNPMGTRDLEWEANVFGGALLIPPRLVRRELRLRERHADHTEYLAEAFDVSPSAMGPRWAHHYAFAR